MKYVIEEIVRYFVDADDEEQALALHLEGKVVDCSVEQRDIYPARGQ